jgi:hypothetical protein
MNNEELSANVRGRRADVSELNWIES